MSMNGKSAETRLRPDVPQPTRGIRLDIPPPQWWAGGPRVPAPILALGFLLIAWIASAGGAEPLYPRPDPEGTAVQGWIETIRERIPPLVHDRGDRWPMILWESGGHDPLPVETVHMLLARGLTQHIRMRLDQIPTALALQAAGSPVIILEGRSGGWPYPPEGDDPSLFHPGRLAPWAEAAQRIRRILTAFRDAGVTVDAVWLDFENQPSMARREMLLEHPELADGVPAAALADGEIFRDYRRQLWIQLLSAYVAGPVREVFPRASVTNWVATLSSRERPVIDWTGHPQPPLGPTLFTATNPLAYAIDTAFLHGWRRTEPIEARAVDRFFMHVLLRQVSANGWNLARQAPYLQAIPWVARWVADHIDRPVPVMSRKAYREGLRHLWLRGVDAMMVFNHPQPGHWEMAVAEVADAVAIYDEMLAEGPFLEAGEVMTFDTPGPFRAAPFWSGLRRGDAAVARIHAPGPEAGAITIEPWPGFSFGLWAPAGQGVTYRITRPTHVPDPIPDPTPSGDSL